MPNDSVLEVRVSRKLLLILMLVGALFLCVGLEIGFLHKLIGPEVGADKALVKWAFVLISVLLGGMIAVNCLIYFISPPLMLKITKDKIVFGTGLRYTPYEIPTRLLENFQTFTVESNLEVNGVKKIVEGGASFCFKNDPSIPNQLVTSMGIRYDNFQLVISSTYADISGKQIVEEAKKIL